MAQRGPTRPPNRGGRAAMATWLLLAILGAASVAGEPYGNNNNGGGGGVGIHIGGGINLGLGELQRCPKVCSCSGQAVDCSHRSLTQVPRRIPLDTEKL